MDHKIVTTKLGKIKGSIVKLEDGVRVEVFRNIRFAKPPTGQRRFMPPERSEPWSGILDATKPGNMPVYPTTLEDSLKKTFPMLEQEDSPQVRDEDCLHLSLYAPANSIGKKLPVMMWIYGGGFQMGSERMYDGTMIAGMNDVIVVVPNYRVGVLGFLSFGKDSVCPGNAGLLDQQEALRWIQNNIEEFGGDRNNVTIFGESAGAASVHLNVISPLAKGLFHKAISHSGQHQLVERFQSDEILTKGKLALTKHFKIESENDGDVLKALQNVPVEDLSKACEVVVMEGVFFMPAVDGKVLPKALTDSFNRKEFAKVPYIIGCNNTEGDGILSMFTPQGEGNFAKGLSEDEAKTSILIPPVTDEGNALLRKRYLKDCDGDLKFSKFIGRAVGDSSFVAPAIESAIAHHESGADVYCYLGSFQLKMHHDDAYGDVLNKPDWCECDHGDDIIITFGTPFAPFKLPMNVKFTEDEKKLSKEFMTYLTNFAKTGDPNVGNPVGQPWPKYKPGGKHLVVKYPMSTKDNYGIDVNKFWTKDIVPHLKTM